MINGTEDWQPSMPLEIGNVKLDILANNLAVQTK